MKYSTIIVAAGQGSRMNLGYNKVYFEIDKGQTILEKTMEVFENDENCKQIIIVTEGSDYKKHTNNKFSGQIVVVSGGNSRQESVYNGLFAVKEDIVFIHDGARPFLTQECINRLCTCMETHDACLLTVPCKDTIKVVKKGIVEVTLERSTLVQAQTPQVFKTSLILECYKKAMTEGVSATDDASLVEYYHAADVMSVEGDYNNIKITTVEDIK